MNRRDAIKKVAIMLGGAFSAPTLLAMEQWEMGSTGTLFNPSFNLTESQKRILAEVAELILPRTDTPGAKDAGVPAFIEMMMKDCYKEPEHLSFLEGLKTLEESQFLSLSEKEKIEVLKKIEADTKEQMKARQVKQTKMGDNEDKEEMKQVPKGLPFWRLIKELTLLGYFTSEVGIKASFEYVPIPTKLEFIKLKPNQKAYVY